MRWHGREKEFAEFRNKGKFVDIECLSFENKKHKGMKILAAALQMPRSGCRGVSNRLQIAAGRVEKTDARAFRIGSN